MVEAATGTGKTLAYLVPALAAGRRVVVSTGTRNLQDQLHEQDLPFLRDRAGLPVRAVVMKGRDNYLCRYRLAQFEREPLLEKIDEQPWVERIARWSRETASGDRAEIADLPDRLRLWRDHAAVRHRNFVHVPDPEGGRIATRFAVENSLHDGGVVHKSNCNFFEIRDGRFSRVAVYMAGENTLEG